jgi:quinol monooxygenase YgiN
MCVVSPFDPKTSERDERMRILSGSWGVLWEEAQMKRSLIAYTYRLDAGSRAAWHRQVAEFIEQLDKDPALGGRIRYRCMKAKESESYYHLAEVADDQALEILRERAYFKRYTEETKRVGGGSVDVTPLETIAESKP